MLDRAVVQAWLDAYVQAWKTYNKESIGNLFSEDATYFYSPYSTPVHDRDNIVASWLDETDSPGTYDGHYEPLLIEGDRAVTNGRSRYFEQDGTTLKAEWDNIFVLLFDTDCRCKEYREWYMKRPSS